MQLRDWRGTSQPATSRLLKVALAPHEAPASRVVAKELVENIPTHVQQVTDEIQKKQVEVEHRLGSGALQPFRPSHTVLQKLGMLPNFDDLWSTVANTYSGSENYLGDLRNAHIRSANIPDSQNCSLWILGLPANVTYSIFLGAIRDTGSVYATVINPPSGPHRTSAAKLIFFERYQAERLFLLIQTGGFRVMGQSVVDVRWNKIKSAPYPHPDHSRAIRITGPAHLMDFDFFEIFFGARFTYELDLRGVVHCTSPGMVTHAWHFGSLRCQAASAKIAIERELKGIFTVHWARDPCAFL